jgi:hypothetical protein
VTQPEAVDGIVRQHLVHQFAVADRCIEAAEREMQRLQGWVATHPAERLWDDDLDRACMHTTRLIGAIARAQGRQVASALALCRLGVVGGAKPTGPGGRGPNGSAKPDINPMPRENPGGDIPPPQGKAIAHGSISSSWPGLARPSTSLRQHRDCGAKDVDARAKPTAVRLGFHGQGAWR